MDEFTVEYVSMWKRWNDFDGVSNVREYWMAVLINFIITAILAALGRAFSLFNIIDYIYGIALIIPAIALFIRRMHDINRSGWNWLWGLIPIVGWIYVIYLLIQPTGKY